MNSMRKKSSTRCGKAAKRVNAIPGIDNQAAHRNLKIASWMMVQMKARQENHTLIQVPPGLQKEEYTDSEVPEHKKPHQMRTSRKRC